MNFFWGFLLVLLLFNEPSMAQEAVVEGSVAQDSLVLDTAVTDSSESSLVIDALTSMGLEIGGGSSFVVGLEWWPYSKTSYNFGLSIRTQYVYDYIDHESGFLLFPSIRYPNAPVAFAVGPKMGWFTSSGFDYGASFRIEVLFVDYEMGYLINKRHMFATITFVFSIPRMILTD